jgi:hypothetical protein
VGFVIRDYDPNGGRCIGSSGTEGLARTSCQPDCCRNSAPERDSTNTLQEVADDSRCVSHGADFTTIQAMLDAGQDWGCPYLADHVITDQPPRSSRRWHARVGRQNTRSYRHAPIMLEIGGLLRSRSLGRPIWLLMFAASTALSLRFRLANNDLAKLSAGFEVPRRQQRSADTPALW